MKTCRATRMSAMIFLIAGVSVNAAEEKGNPENPRIVTAKCAAEMQSADNAPTQENVKALVDCILVNAYDEIPDAHAEDAEDAKDSDEPKFWAWRSIGG